MHARCRPLVPPYSFGPFETTKTTLEMTRGHLGSPFSGITSAVVHSWELLWMLANNRIVGFHTLLFQRTASTVSQDQHLLFFLLFCIRVPFGQALFLSRPTWLAFELPPRAPAKLQPSGFRNSNNHIYHSSTQKVLKHTPVTFPFPNHRRYLSAFRSSSISTRARTYPSHARIGAVCLWNN